MPVKPMRIDIPQADVQALRQRLANTRWAPLVDGYGWADGTDGRYLRDLVTDWATRYDWRAREVHLNTFPHRLADIDGVQLHFIHAPGQGQRRVPLLLLHGWPSSFVQMLKVIPLLTEDHGDGSPTFDVVAASLPGYPFSPAPTRSGMNFARIADLLTHLMVDELGYDRFAARGSDQGALVQQQLALKHPQRLWGVHRSGITPFATPLPSDLSAAEVAYQREVQAWAPRETAYAALQAQRPETLAPALADSPAGLAAWYLEKFQRWGDGGEDLDVHFGRDALLDHLSLHWFTGAGATAIRLYREAARDPGLSGRVEVPTAIMMPLHDAVTVPAPREWAERTYNVRRWTVLERGGHFPEWEVPEVVAADVRAFFAGLVP